MAPADAPARIDLIERLPRLPDGVRAKRWRRKHSREARRLAAGEIAIFLAGWDVLHEYAAVLPHWEPGDRGRPPDLPPAAHVIFGVLWIQLRSDRDAEAALRYAPTWEAVRETLAPRYPQYRGLQPDAQPISRRELWRFRETCGITDEMLDTLRITFRELAATQARDMHMCDPHAGSVTHPALQNILVGDGTVLAPHYKGSPTDRQLNRETGEMEPVKHDPDANFCETGDDREVAYGIKFGFIESWMPHSDQRVENERVILDVFNVRHEPGYDEAAQATESITALVGLLPGAQAVEWDMALHGIHFDTTRRLGLVDIVKVPAPAANAGRQIPAPRDPTGKRRSGHVFTRTDHTQQQLPLYTYDGHPHIEVIVGGQRRTLPLTKTRLRRIRQRTRGYRWYGRYRIPNHPTVPPNLRDATVTIRLDRAEDDGVYNRAENLRPVTIHDMPIGPVAPGHVCEFDQLYVLRPGAESINRWHKQRYDDTRAPAVGRHRLMFMLLCSGLLNNAKAALAHQQRLRPAA